MTVYGTSTVKVRPDLARIRFRIARLEQTPSQAFAAVSGTVGSVLQVLRRHSVPDDAIHRSQLDLRSERSYGAGHPEVVGYQGSAGFAVETRDLDNVERLIVDVVAAGANEIEGIEFDVVDKDALRVRARRQAVADARSKAELYAEAADVRLGTVLHIEDVSSERGGYDVVAMTASASDGSSSGEVLVPGQISISAAVVVGSSINRD